MIDWSAFQARLKKESADVIGSSQDGVCVVTVSVAMDGDGNPIVWLISNSAKVEPSKDAKRVLLQLLG